MSLYAQIAPEPGVLMYICYVSFSTPAFSSDTYVYMGVWIVAVLLFFGTVHQTRQQTGMDTESQHLHRGSGHVDNRLPDDVRLQGGYGARPSGRACGVFGLACITSVLNRYNGDFKMVARIAGRKVSDRDLHFRSMITQIISVIFSNAIMLCVVTVWVFVIPASHTPELPWVFRSTMVQLPVLFMLVSVFFALRQPLDERSRQKLLNYTQGTNNNTPYDRNLHQQPRGEEKR